MAANDILFFLVSALNALAENYEAVKALAKLLKLAFRWLTPNRRRKYKIRYRPLIEVKVNIQIKIVKK